MQSKSFIFYLLMNLILIRAAIAQEGKSQSVWVEKNKQISKELDKTATILDTLFTDNPYSEEKNSTTLIIENSIDWLDGKDIVYKPHVDIRLHLPNLEKKWKLRFTSYDEDSEDRGINKNRLKTEAPRETYGASISFSDTFGKIDTTFRPRLEYKNNTITTSFILRFEREIKRSFFRILPRLEFFARSDTGTGQFTAINFDIPIGEKYSFGVVNEQQYTNLDHLLSVTHGLRFNHVYNDRMMQIYAFNLEYNNRPAYHLERYTLSSSFNHKLYRNMFHYSIIPYILWHEDNQFSGKGGLEIKFEFIF